MIAIIWININIEKKIIVKVDEIFLSFNDTKALNLIKAKITI
jgi:hypothetical protein